jgi:hypothetical protein
MTCCYLLAGSFYDPIQFDSYPMSLSYTDDQMWVGDKGGEIHLLDATDGDFNIVEVSSGTVILLYVSINHL